MAGILAAALVIALGWSLLTVQRLEQHVATLTAEMATREETIRLLADPQARAVHLPGLPGSPNATGLLLWNPVARTGVLVTTGLAEAPADRTYALWAMAGAEAVPAATFTVDEKGRGVVWLPPLPGGKEFDRFAVTLEPAGAVSKPSGPMRLLGSL